jgi:TatD DNase family protein
MSNEILISKIPKRNYWSLGFGHWGFMLIDTHAHINFKDYKTDGDEVVKRALENGVWLINVGAEFETSKRAVEYSKNYPEGVFAAVGLHPIHLTQQKFKEKDLEFESKAEEFDEKIYRELASRPKVVAIGEIGMDYYRIKDDDLGIKEKQKEVFKKQIELAIELELPIMIHCRNAHADVLEILKSYILHLKSQPKGVIHSFSGNYKQAREYRKMGFKIAFNGIITFARDYDKVILDTPLKDILIETDCPYLTPVPYRGKRNEPLYVIEVAKKLAEIKGISLEEVAEQTTKNAKELFKI